MIYFLYLILLSGFIFTRGFFSLNGVFILLVALILFVITLLRRKLLEQPVITAQMLLPLLSILSAVMYGGLYQRNIMLVFLSLILLAINIFLAIFFIANNPTQSKRNIFLLMFGIAFLSRLFMIWSSPSPYIDVYDYLKNGALSFLHGQNPYSITYTKFYENVTPDFYSYLPGMLILTTPFVAVLGDPRYAVVFAEVLAAIIIYKLSKNKTNGYLYSLLIINNPISLFMVEQSYTEPVIVFLLTAIAFLFIKKRYLLTSIFLGILLATKQYAILLIPMFYQLIAPARAALARLFVAVFAAGMIILPFFLWNKTDFIHDAILLQYNFPPRYEGLSFFSMLYRFGINYNFIFSSIIIGLLFIFIYTRKVEKLSSFFYLSAFLYLIFFFFNKWAFINYYYLVSQLLLLGGILRENKL